MSLYSFYISCLLPTIRKGFCFKIYLNYVDVKEGELYSPEEGVSNHLKLKLWPWEPPDMAAGD